MSDMIKFISRVRVYLLLYWQEMLIIDYYYSSEDDIFRPPWVKRLSRFEVCVWCSTASQHRRWCHHLLHQVNKTQMFPSSHNFQSSRENTAYIDLLLWVVCPPIQAHRVQSGKCGHQVQLLHPQLGPAPVLWSTSQWRAHSLLLPKDLHPETGWSHPPCLYLLLPEEI